MAGRPVQMIPNADWTLLMLGVVFGDGGFFSDTARILFNISFIVYFSFSAGKYQVNSAMFFVSCSWGLAVPNRSLS